MSTTAEIQHFAIKTEVFEGPLDLLLDLVEKRKLLINDISLADVTDEYMQYVTQMQAHSLPGTAQFVQLAATLLLLKSRSLLPVLELTEEEESSIEDLEERLKLYQIYRTAGKTVQSHFGARVAHGRQFVAKTKPLFTLDAYTEKDALVEAMYRVLSELPKKPQKPTVRVRTTISLEEMMGRLKERIENHMRVRLSDLLEHESERTTVIVGFLAILESVKQGSVLVHQQTRFSDIEVEKDAIAAPKYY